MTPSEVSFLRSMFINNGTATLVTAQADLEDWVWPGFNIPSGKIEIGTAGMPANGEDGWRNMASIAHNAVAPGLLLGAARKHLSETEFEWYYFWAADGPWLMSNRNILVNQSL